MADASPRPDIFDQHRIQATDLALRPGSALRLIDVVALLILWTAKRSSQSLKQLVWAKASNVALTLNWSLCIDVEMAERVFNFETLSKSRSEATPKSTIYFLLPYTQHRKAAFIDDQQYYSALCTLLLVASDILPT